MITFIFQYVFSIASGFYLLGLVFHFFHRPKISFAVLLAGFFLHTLFQLSRGMVLGIWFPNPIFDSAYFLPWSMAFTGLGMRWFSKDEQNRHVIHSMLLPISIFALLALFFPREIMTPGPKHQTIFVSLYYGIDIIAQVCFILGAWCAAFHLKGKASNRLFNALLVWGFIFYSISQVVGAYWAWLGWALPMHWSAKHLQSASVWCYYAAALHLRYFPTWNSRHDAWFALGGAVLLLAFTYGAQISAFSLPGIGG